MLDLGLPKMKQTDIVGVHVQAKEGVNICCKIQNSVSELMSMCVAWRRLNLAESNAPQTGPIWRSPIWFLYN